MGGVEFVGAECAADRDDIDRELTLEQSAHLHRRRVGAQQLSGALRSDIEGVLFAARRVVGREVERIEVELLGLDFRPLGQFPPHRYEGVGDVLGQNRDRMPRAGRLAGRRQGHVDALGDQDGGIPLSAQRRQPFVVTALNIAAGAVHKTTGVRTIRLGQRGQRLARQRQRRAITKVLGLGTCQCVEVGRGCEGLPGCVDRCGQRLQRQVDGLVTHAATLSLLGF